MGGTESGQPGQYENFDGIRAYACVGIVCMHVLKNGNFGLSGFVFERLIPSFTNFTYLFMILSAFSMCCGYYEKFTSGTVDIERFYRRRYQRVWSYFALLCTVETLLEHTLNALCEWFADITLAFALIPNHGIEIVGVGWFLGVVFVFYMLFPFFAFLMSNRKRAWMTMTATIILHTLCRLRFRDAMGRTNFIYCAMFFAAGGIIYLYRDKLKGKMAQYVSESATPLAAICYYAVNDSEYAMLGLFSLVLIVGISCRGGVARVVFQNKIALFLGSISMEIYLCHMFAYRALERLSLTHILPNPVANYCLASVGALVGAIVMSLAFRKLAELTGGFFPKNA